MSKLSFVLLTCLSLPGLGACGKKSAGVKEALSKLTAFKAKACACKTAECMGPVLVDYQKWTDEFANSKKGQDPMTDADEKEMGTITTAMTECINKIGPAAEPAVPTPSAGSGSAAPPTDDHATAPAGGDTKTEAQLQLNHLGKNAKVYFITMSEFPKGKAAALPAGDCCKTAGKCAPEKEAFAKDAVWAALDFAIEEPNQFHYTYDSEDGKTFHAEASGDPDCSGKTVTYKLDGSNEAGNPVIKFTGP